MNNTQPISGSAIPVQSIPVAQAYAVPNSYNAQHYPAASTYPSEEASYPNMQGHTSIDMINTQQENDFGGQKCADAEVSIRHGFIRKVLGIVAIQLIFTFGVVLVVNATAQEEYRSFINRNSWVYWFSYATFIVLLIAISCCNVGRKHPTGLIFLSILTIALTFVITTISANFGIDTIGIAMGGTVGLVLVLGLFAFQTKYDFTGAGPYLLIFSLLLLFFGLTTIIIGSLQMYIVYNYLFLVLFSMFLVYDIQLIIGGKHKKYQLGIDEYIFAALNVYIDIVYIFLAFLGISD